MRNGMWTEGTGRFGGIVCRAALMGVVALAAGCATSGSANRTSATLPGAPLPTYVAGEQFITSDGASLKVSSVSGDMVVWRYKKGVHLNESRNFIYPTLERKARTSTSTRSISSLNHKALFPLRPGNSTSYTETQVKVSKTKGTLRGKPRYWMCKVEGTQKVDIMMGSFDTFRVGCERIHKRRNYKNKVVTYYYAPSVGRVVLETRGGKFNKVPDKRIELMGARPPLAAMGIEKASRQGAYAAFQKALDGQPSKVASVWRDARSGAEVRTMVDGTYQRQDGSFCRRYVQEVTPNPGNRVYPGLACRGKDGRWSIPRG